MTDTDFRHCVQNENHSENAGLFSCHVLLRVSLRQVTQLTHSDYESDTALSDEPRLSPRVRVNFADNE